MPRADSPKDRFITVYGHRPVQAALDDPDLAIDKVMIADGERGPAARQIESTARGRGVDVQRAPAHRIKLLSGNGKHDNGVLADVIAPGMRTLTAALDGPDRPRQVLLLDGVRTPSNVGMILRTATAAGLDGIVIPHRGVASIDPLVIKASAGVAFRAPVLRSGTSVEAARQLRDAGFRLVGLAASGDHSIFTVELGPAVALVLGSETDGIGPEVGELITDWVTIPMPGAVESLNVASAAAVACFELVRRGHDAP
ncbi:TrmH family RNA methyltransferase [Microlunatus sp. GCM10028923]|uniref:TrmH family RNA methyltransferase n=1 Tax=Microlunatus sp. GCM10028923 TaxID=3273400 RepID=UPI00360A8DDF